MLRFLSRIFKQLHLRITNHCLYGKAIGLDHSGQDKIGNQKPEFNSRFYVHQVFSDRPDEVNTPGFCNKQAIEEVRPFAVDM
jgi:hypothetical protein